MLKPSFECNNVPIVFSSDNNYIKYLYVTIKSLICNSSKDYNYDIYILDEDICKNNKDFLQELEADNLKITFINIKHIMNNIDKSIFYLNAHPTLATYYRFFVPRIFENFDKVLYLDSDILILDDIVKLYNYPLNNKIVGAIQDITMQDIICLKEETHINYLNNKLKLSNNDHYFQAGVLIFDIKKMIEFDCETKFINCLKELKKPLYPDQCVLNKVLENHVQYIEQEWNIQWQLPIFSKGYKKRLPKDLLKAYEKGLKNPKILHFSGRIKPWFNILQPNAYLFWKYAFLCPMWKNLLIELFLNSTKKFNLLRLLCVD